MTDFANLGIRFVPVDDGAANKALTDVAANSVKAEDATKKLTATQIAAANTQKAMAQVAQVQAAAVMDASKATERATSAMQEMAEAIRNAERAMRPAVQQAKQLSTAQMEAASGWGAVGKAWNEFDFVRDYQAATVAMKDNVVTHGAAAAATKITAAQTLNLSRQFADVAVTGAMGMSPLMILIQQGPQIGETIGEIARDAGGLSGALRLMATSAWAALAPFAPFIAAAGLLAAAIGGPLLMATHELNKGNDDLAQRLGLTDEQMKKVGNTSITVADVIQGTFKYAAKAIGEQFAPQITWLQKAFAAAYEFIKNATVSAVKVFAGLWGAQIAAIQALWHNVKAFMKGEPLIDVKDAALKGYADAVAGVDRTMSGLAKTIREVRDARVLEAAGTAKATKELKDHTKATKDYLTVAEMVADTSKTVDILANVKAIKVESVPDLKDVAGEAAKAWEEYQAEGQRVIDELGADIEREFVQSGKLSWDSIGKYAEQTLRQAVYESLLKKPIQIIIDGVFGNLEKLKTVLGNVLGGSLGKVLGAAGVGASIGQSMGLGTGNTLADLGLAAGGGALGTMAGSALGTWAAAAAGQAALTGASTMLATTLGWLAPALGPIGAIIGLAAGTLFKSKPSNNGALATLDGNTFSLSGNKRTDETSQMATNAANAILQGQSILEAAGIKLAATVKTIDIGTRDATDIILSDGRALTSAVGDAAAAAETALKAVLEGATYASDAQKKLVESMVAAGKGFDDIAAALDKYAQAQGLADQIALQIQQLTDPQAYDLAVLQKAQKEQRDSLKALADQGFLTADQFASISAQLTTLEGLQIAKVMGAANDNAAAIQSASQALSEARDREAAALQETIDRLRGFAESLRQYGASLGLAAAGAASPAALYTRTRAAFMRTAAAAATGDETAMAALQGSGEAYLSASKAYQSTSLGYLRDLAYVRQAVSATAQTATEQADAAQRQLDLMNKQVDALLKVDASVLSVRDAIAALSAAMGGKAAGGFNASGYLSKNPDVAAAYQTYLQNQTGYAVGYGAGLSATEFAQIHWDRGGMNEGRGFATGGSFTVGGTGGPDSQAFNLRLSPGEMVNVRRPDQVDNAAAEETRALREQVAQLIGVTIKMAGDMEKMQRTLTNVTRGGDVMQTEVAA